MLENCEVKRCGRSALECRFLGNLLHNFRQKFTQIYQWQDELMGVVAPDGKKNPGYLAATGFLVAL